MNAPMCSCELMVECEAHKIVTTIATAESRQQEVLRLLERVKAVAHERDLARADLKRMMTERDAYREAVLAASSCLQTVMRRLGD